MFKFEIYNIFNCQLQSQQYFRTRPQPTAEVIEGGTLTLQCGIGNQRGSVQWAKDGFVLGFDRSIPGYERYSMTGDANIGVHNLRIVRAKNEDQGEYQCQVGPGPGGNQPIRATTKLTVLIPPSSIEITGHTNQTQVEVKEGQSMDLECVVTGGKPSAQIKWFRKNIELRTDNVTVRTASVDNELMVSGHQPTEVSVSVSTITVRPHAEDNGVMYTCEAIHTALLAPMRHSLTLSVLYPPGSPEITGYIEGETVRMGDTLTLVCKSIGGNPLAQLVWYKNDEEVDFSFTTTANRQSANSHTFVVDASDNNAVYRCVASSSITQTPMVAEVKLQVHFAPAKVYINGTKEAKSGDTVTMTCHTERSNPPSELSWVVDGRPVTATNSIVADPLGGWVSSANVTVVVTPQDRNMKMLSCYAINQALGETIVETAVLSILYPPDPPNIFGYTEGTSIRAGSLQRLTCVCNGGNPLCNLKWFKGETEIISGTTVSTNGNVVSNEIAIITKDSDNGAQYRCEASNSATIEPLIAIIQLTVHFPPSGVFIKMSPKQPKAGTHVELVCETGSSNPESVVTWWRDGFLLNGHQDGIIDGLYGGKTTRNILRLNVSSDDDGTVLTCQATNRVLQQSVHDATTLSIQYSPEFLNSPLTQFDIIEGQPSVINLTAKGNPSQIEYKWSRQTETITAATETTTGSPIDSPRIQSSGPILNISEAKRGDSGVYKLYAQNELGLSETAIKINVQYSAQILKVSEMVMIDEWANAYLECNVDANPSTDTTITWRRRFRNESDAIVTQEIDSSRMRETIETIDTVGISGSGYTLKGSLAIYNTSLEDSGQQFECVANNGIGDSDTAIATLLVLHKPIIDRSPIISKSATDDGSSGRLYCRAQAAPNVTFTWTREGQILSTDSKAIGVIKSESTSDKQRKGSELKEKEVKYIIEPTQQLDLVNYQSVLIILDVQSQDYGAYQCIARNDLGFDAITIQLNRTSKPDPPLALRILNITESSVQLRWIPGFDGGIGQDFRLRYRPTSSSDPSFTYKDVYPANSTQIILTGLNEDTEYMFGVQAINTMGHSDFTIDIVKAKTLKETPVTETEKIISKIMNERAGDLPKLILIVSVVGSSLLLFNIVLVVCFVRKRRRKRYEEESDGTESKTTGSSKTTMEMYQSSNSTAYHKENNETSLSEEDDENKSQNHDNYSGHTDYEMEISPSGVVTTHSHGISTYLIDDAIAPSQHYPNTRFTSLVSPVGPDLTTSTYFIDHPNDEYASALRKNAYNQQLAVNSTGSLSPSPLPPLQPLSISLSNSQSPINSVNYMGTRIGDHLSQSHSPNSHYQPSLSLSPHHQQSQQLMHQTVPPLPPLRSIGAVAPNMTSFMPTINEEPRLSYAPMGHLV
ncbi:nephrin-like isoform X2 [Oppia nitens]|uniref:nephrin-like isoform X2 n=1 Tax=Oppia nitens TaxID=1686743 RepID=UPI0023DA9EBA|nr:nephrin-like isoform X2 [Oppia nitens]